MRKAARNASGLSDLRCDASGLRLAVLFLLHTHAACTTIIEKLSNWGIEELHWRIGAIA